MNTIENFKKAINHLISGNLLRFLWFLYFALLSAIKDIIFGLFEFLKLILITPVRNKVIGIVIFLGMIASLMLLGKLVQSDNTIITFIKIIVFYIVFLLGVRTAIIAMKGDNIISYLSGLSFSIFSSGKVPVELKEWNKKHGSDLESLKNNIYEIMKIYKLYIKHEDKPSQFMYLNEDTTINPLTDEITFSLGIPVGMAFGEINKDNVRQSLLQAFQRYFPSTDSVKLSNAGNTLKIESHTKRQSMIMNKSTTLGLIDANNEMEITFGIGIEDGEPVRKILGKPYPNGFPHILITGTTGSGKSSALNNIIITLSRTNSPEDIQLFLFDPKGTEFSPYEKMKHTKMIIKNDIRKIAEEIIKISIDMESTYILLEEAGVKTIEQYNKTIPEGKEKLKRKIIIVDEIINIVGYLGGEDKDLLKGFKTALRMISAKGRAASYLLILASQRLSAETLDTDIKSQLSKIAFRSETTMDSINAIDIAGAESLFETGVGVIVEPSRETGGRILKEFKGFYIDDEDIIDIVKSTSNYWDEVGHNGEETIVKGANRGLTDDRWDRLFTRMETEECFKIAWYNELGFTQKEIKSLSKILQEKGIIYKNPDNSLNLIKADQITINKAETKEYLSEFIRL